MLIYDNITIIFEGEFMGEKFKINDPIQILNEKIRHLNFTHSKCLYETWEKHNEQYFGNRLNPIEIKIQITDFNSAIGIYGGHIGILYGLFADDHDESKSASCPEFIEDVILHEMIHQNIHENPELRKLSLLPKSNTTSHNNRGWINEINRIAGMMDGLIQFNSSVWMWKKRPQKRKSRRKKTDPIPQEKTKYKNIWVPEGVKFEKRDYTDLEIDEMKNEYLSMNENSGFPHSVRIHGFYSRVPKIKNDDV